MFHECEAQHPKLDPSYVEDTRYRPQPTLIANLPPLLGFTGV